MTNEDVLDGNQTIADFMGIKAIREHSILTGIGNFYLVDEQQ